jgi:hypothetical protein
VDLVALAVPLVEQFSAVAEPAVEGSPEAAKSLTARPRSSASRETLSLSS